MANKCMGSLPLSTITNALGRIGQANYLSFRSPHCGLIAGSGMFQSCRVGLQNTQHHCRRTHVGTARCCAALVAHWRAGMQCNLHITRSPHSPPLTGKGRMYVCTHAWLRALEVTCCHSASPHLHTDYSKKSHVFKRGRGPCEQQLFFIIISSVKP